MGRGLFFKIATPMKLCKVNTYDFIHLLFYHVMQVYVFLMAFSGSLLAIAAKHPPFLTAFQRRPFLQLSFQHT